MLDEFMTSFFFFFFSFPYRFFLFSLRLSIVLLTAFFSFPPPFLPQVFFCFVFFFFSFPLFGNGPYSALPPFLLGEEDPLPFLGEKQDPESPPPPLFFFFFCRFSGPVESLTRGTGGDKFFSFFFFFFLSSEYWLGPINLILF